MEHTLSPIPNTPGISTKQELCPRLTLETLHDGKIWCFTFGRRPRDAQDSPRTAIDIWVQSMKDQVKGLAYGEFWYRLHDFSQTDMNPTPYFIARLSEIAKYRPELRGHSAYVIPRNIFTQVMWNLSHRLRPRHIQVRLFFDREEALRWLESRLDAAHAAVVAAGAKMSH